MRSSSRATVTRFVHSLLGGSRTPATEAVDVSRSYSRDSVTRATLNSGSAALAASPSDARASNNAGENLNRFIGVQQRSSMAASIRRRPKNDTRCAPERLDGDGYDGRLA